MNTHAPSLHINWLDSLRGFAVLFVFLYHCLGWAYGSKPFLWDGQFRDLGQPLDYFVILPLVFGWSGVAIFFVVSGFCIHLSYSKNPKWVSFFWRRFWRIWPPYFAALLLFFVTDYSIGNLSRENGFVQLISHSFLVHNFSRLTHFGINPSFWSIAVEAQLYLVYPLLLAIQSRIGWRNCLWVALGIEILLNMGGMAFHAASIQFPFFLSQSPFAYWFSWSIGAWIAHVYSKGLSVPWPRLAHPVILGLAAFLCWLYRPTEPLLFLLMSALTASLIVQKLNRNTMFRHIEASGQRSRFIRVLEFFGQISFSLYLLHQPIISICNIMLNKIGIIVGLPHYLHFTILIMVAWPVVTLSSWMFYKTAEVGSIALGKTLWKRILC
jgi:peptidoglycan/LPS O-acetylase OafA/YrhL